MCPYMANARPNRSRPEGIVSRHRRRCASQGGAACDCRPAYQAQVWSPRDQKTIRKTFQTLADARAWRAEATSALRLGTMRAPTRTTVAEAAEAWLCSAKAGITRTRSGESYKPSAIRAYEQVFRATVLPNLGHLRLSAYVLFFIELQSRRVRLAACTANPSGRWVAQQARNLSLSGSLPNVRFLIHDRDSKFSAAFDEVFRSEGIRVIKTRFRAPRANAHAERFVRTVRAECLDWLLILGPRHLERVLRVYVERYNRERPHRAVDLHPLAPPEPSPAPLAGRIKRRDRLGGLLHEYYRTAA
jgi:integrase-like protein